MNTKTKFWIGGIMVAATGLALARLIAPLFTNQPGVQLTVFLTGVVLAMAGLGIILLGMRKK